MENTVACWSWACFRAAVRVGPCQSWELRAEFSAIVLMYVLLGQSSSGGWKQQWLAGRGVSHLTAKRLSSLPQMLPFFPLWTTLDWRKGYKNVKKNCPKTVKMGGKYLFTVKVEKKICNITFLLQVIGWGGFISSVSSPLWLCQVPLSKIKQSPTGLCANL